jgi:hypothetical protein
VRCLTVGLLLVLLVPAGCLWSQAVPHEVTLTGHPTNAWETTDTSVDLQGTTTVNGPIKNIVWVNQMGVRGTGTWVAASGTSANWTAAAIPLRLGINLVAITVVYGTNDSASLHLAINRKPAAGAQPPQPLEVRTGIWKNRPITYRIWNGMAVVEGDIILGPAASMEPNPSNGGGFTSDGVSISYTSQLWPTVGASHQVPYIVTGSSANLTTAISQFNSQFSDIIQFVTRTSQTNYVNITVEAGGSGEGYSNVGMAGGEQTLECGSGCTVATWLHEMGHTVGLYHEHQRPDRNNFITLNLTNADLPNVPGNFTLFSFDYQTSGLYDYTSVMHYGPFDFSKAGLPVIESIPAGIPLGNTVGYSAGDVDQISRLYGFAPQTVTVTTNPPGLQLQVSPYGSQLVRGPVTLTLPRNSTFTVNAAPVSGAQQTDPADGSYYVFANWSDQGASSHSITVSPGSGTLISPATAPAVTVYQANFVRLQPFATTVYPSGAATESVTPAPPSQYSQDCSCYPDRTLIQITVSPAAGYNFYDWFNLPYPPSSNPHQFYIQSPLTNGQAVLVSTPVTTIGESLTGPNTWNPGTAGYVDGDFNYFPTAFTSYYNGTSWNSGTTHSIDVPQTQSPVTTNVFYNWNNWSDGGAITHNITQPASGTQTISASLTPFYAFYTVPSPLGAQNSSCYGGVTTSPAGVAYTENSTFDFYSDGTSVTSSATANSAFPGLTFAGWSGSLTGSTNPDTTTIHDQFVPSALFNTSTTPLAINSLSPASVPASGNPTNITITGTGFSSATTVYWNGAGRSVTYVSSTQLTLQLNAGDLSNPGGQDIYVQNSVAGGSNTYCGVGAETSLTVTSPAPGSNEPFPGFVGYPSTGGYQGNYYDPKGALDLTTVRILISNSITAAHSCYVLYNPAANAMYLENDAGTGVSAAVTPGSFNAVSNSQCTLSGLGSSVNTTTTPNTMSVNYELSFSSAYLAQEQKIYLLAGSNNGGPGWVETAIVPASTVAYPQSRTVSPNSGAGVTQTFSALYTDPKGWADITETRVLLNSTLSAVNGCYVFYEPAQNAMYLENEAGTGKSGAVTPGSQSSVSFGGCTLNGAGSSVSTSGFAMTVNYALSGMGGNIYLLASNSSGSYGWNQVGSWTSVPTGISLSPNSGSGQTQAFTAVYYDRLGASDIGTARILFGPSVTPNYCYVQYNPAANAMYLYGSSTAVTPGSSASVSNSYCTLSGSGSAVSKSGNDLTLTYALSFSSSFTGGQNVYLLAGNNSQSSGWVQLGTWTP